VTSTGRTRSKNQGYGAYGVGEDTGASMSGITVSAIHNATGKWVLDYPTTPEKVLKALGKI